MVHPDLLSRIDLFGELTKDQIGVLSRNSDIRAFRPGDVLARETASDRTFHLLLSGRVKLSKTSADGREQILFLFGPGEPFCLCAYFQRQPLPGTLTALEDSRVLTVPGPTLERLVREDPSLFFGLLGVLARRLKNALQLVETLALREVPQRVAAYLLHAAPINCGLGGPDSFQLCTSQREMAKALGTTPESLSRALRRMKTEDLIQVRGRTVRILDRDGLQLLASA